MSERCLEIEQGWQAACLLFHSFFRMFHYEVGTSSFSRLLGLETGLYWSRNRCVRCFSLGFFYAVQCGFGTVPFHYLWWVFSGCFWFGFLPG